MYELSLDTAKSVTGGRRDDPPPSVNPSSIRNAVLGYLADKAGDRAMEGLNSLAREHAANVASRQPSGSIKPGEDRMSDSAANYGLRDAGFGGGERVGFQAHSAAPHPAASRRFQLYAR